MKTLTKMLVLAALVGSATNMAAGGVKDRIEEFVEKVPGIGLISDSITFDGITISDFHFIDGKKYIFLHPNEETDATFNYQMDSDQLASLHLHHFIIGLEGDGPQGCVLHTLGVTNSSGTAKFTLKAPEKKGAYQVRFCHSENLTDEQAKQAWWRGDGASSKTIVGVVVVK